MIKKTILFSALILLVCCNTSQKGGQEINIQTKTVGGIEFVLVNGGEFLMGLPDGQEDKDEQPQHKVILDPFWIGKYEVTQDQYQEIMGENPSHFKGGKNPVEQVQWPDAIKFCDEFGKKHGVTIRLPYEAEWEYAARGGTTTTFFWGDKDSKMHEYCNYSDKNSESILKDKKHDDGFAGTAPVGSLKANPFGLHDMLGNVYEWCMDYYSEGYYANSPEKNPCGPDTGDLHIGRGGSFSNTSEWLRCAGRNAWAPDRAVKTLGFRVVLAEK